jgi:hypothetical protein
VRRKINNADIRYDHVRVSTLMSVFHPMRKAQKSAQQVQVVSQFKQVQGRLRHPSAHRFIMPPLPRSALSRVVAARQVCTAFRQIQGTTHRYYASVDSSASATVIPDMFLNGPPQRKTMEKVDLIKFAGKKKPITPVSISTRCSRLLVREIT